MFFKNNAKENSISKKYRYWMMEVKAVCVHGDGVIIAEEWSFEMLQDSVGKTPVAKAVRIAYSNYGHSPTVLDLKSKVTCYSDSH